MELLLVMAILVILLSFVAPRFIGTQKKADIDAARNQIKLFKQPLKLYSFEMKDFPSTEEGLIALIEAPETMENPEKYGGPFLDAGEVPLDPWDNPYQYRYPPERNRDDPDIWSMGPDGEDNTEDDIGNWPDDDAAGE
jgi:general secretion pathway protein G